MSGEVATHFKQPAMVGQLLVGMLLGTTLLGPFLGLNPTSSTGPALSPQLGTMQILATVFILFMAGLEVSPEDIFTMELSTVILGLSVLFIPFGLAATVLPFVLHQISFLEGLLIAVTLSITVLPVMGLMLQEFGLSESRIRKLLINTALLNEFSKNCRAFSITPNTPLMTNNRIMATMTPMWTISINSGAEGSGFVLLPKSPDSPEFPEDETKAFTEATA